MTENPQQNPLKLERLHADRQRNFLRSGLFSFSGLVLAGFAFLTLFEHYFYLHFWVKSFFLLAVVLAVSFLSFRFFRQKQLDLRDFVKRLSDELGSDKLIRYFDLEHAAGSPFEKLASKQLGDELVSAGITEKLASARLLERTKARLKYSALFLTVSGFAFASSAFFFTDALQRSATFWTTFFPPNPYVFSISPGDITLEMGSAFETAVQFRGRQPRLTWLEIKSDDEGSWRKMPLQKTNDSTFSVAGLLLNSHFSYRVRMDEYTSGTYLARVEMLPRWEKLLVQLQPPAYTGEPATLSEYPITQFEALPGTRITLLGKSNKPLASASLEAFHHAPGVSVLRSDSLQATFLLTQPDTLSFQLTDELGLKNKNPFSLSFSLLNDQPPTVALISPDALLELSAPDTVRLRYAAQDDFGIKSITLFWKLDKGITNASSTGSQAVPRGNNRKLITESFLLDLNSFKMEALDQLTYWLEVVDNDQVSGFKTSVSGRQVIRIAGLADMLMNMEEMEENVSSGLEDADKEFKSVQEDFKALKESLQKQDALAWDQQQQIQQMEENLERVQEKVDEVKEEFDKLREELEKNSIVSEETQKQYEELQKLMDEIDDPNILKLLEEMQKGLQNIDQNQLRQALEKFEFSEERYRERLQRTMELFKSLQTMAELDKLEKRLQELEKTEEKLDSPETDSERFEKTQKAVKKDLKDFEEAAKKLSEKAAEKQQENVEKLQQELKQDTQELQKQLEESIQQNKKSGQKRPKTDEIRKKMQQMQKKIAESREGMSQKALNINILALKSALLDLIFLSELEEQVMDDVGALDFRAQGFTAQARKQSSLTTQFKRVADTLASVSKEIPQFSNRILEKKSEVVKRLDSSLGFLAERDKNNSSSTIRFAMGGINELASMLADLISQMEEQQQSGEGGDGMSSQQMMDQMQQMSGQQQKLNQQMQDLINDIQGNRLNQGQMERLNQLAQQQNEIRKKLREMQQKSGLSPGDKILSELERLAEQMEESINEMRGGGTDRVMITRQQNILSRMLEVEKSLDQRDEDEKRKGDRPKDLPPAVRPTMTMEELKKAIQQRLQNPNQSKFSPEFEELVRLYFELIGS